MYVEPELSNTQPVSANSDIVDYANQFIGNPYVYGGNSLTDGIDCSHFVYQVLTNTGHYNGGYATSDGWVSLGSEVSSLDEAVAGDVIVYPGHVAFYDGAGGLIEAQGSSTGITSGRPANHGTILAIRHFD
jgi:cell wall-associated NlpC family hydrolase